MRALTWEASTSLTQRGEYPGRVVLCHGCDWSCALPPSDTRLKKFYSELFTPRIEAWFKISFNLFKEGLFGEFWGSQLGIEVGE